LSVCTEVRPRLFWFAVGANAFVGGVLVGWAIANIPVESLGIGGWLRSLALAAVAIAAPVVLSVAIMCSTPVPAFFRIFGPKEYPTPNSLPLPPLIILPPP